MSSTSEQNPEPTRQIRWRLRNPAGWTAHKHVANAKRRGELVPEPCEICGARAEAHHPDYSKPLEVRWLCRRHHVRWHADRRRKAAPAAERGGQGQKKTGSDAGNRCGRLTSINAAPVRPARVRRADETRS